MKKAFTLVEMLAVVVILAILILISTKSISGLIRNSKEKLYNNEVKNIVTSLKMYASDNLISMPHPGQKLDITLYQLKQYGYIKDVKNPKTGKSFKDDSILTITNIDGRYEYSFNVSSATNINNYDTVPDLYYKGDALEIYKIGSNYSEDVLFAKSYNGTDLKNSVIKSIKYIDLTTMNATSVSKIYNSASGLYQITYKLSDSNNTVSIIKNIIYEGNGVSIADAIANEPIETPASCFIYNLINDNTNVEITDYVCSYEDGSNYYNLEENEIITDVVIPSKIENKNVTSIGTGAFSYNDLTSVVIPSSITSIGENAFDSNSLTSVVIPSGVTSISNYAFFNNSLTSVVIPNGVTLIGDYSFSENNLTSVVIPSGVTSIGEGAFYYNSLTSVEIPSSVTSIGNYAFSNNSLTSVVIPSGVTSINERSFQYNNLTSVVIPNSVTTIGYGAFSSNNLTSVVIPSGVTSIGQSAFSKNLSSNTNLTTITNKTGKSFDWGLIINNSTGYNFITGTLVNSTGNVTIN